MNELALDLKRVLTLFCSVQGDTKGHQHGGVTINKLFMTFVTRAL